MSIMDGLKEWRRWLDGSPIKVDMSRLPTSEQQEEINRLRNRIKDLESEREKYWHARQIATREYRDPSQYIDDVLQERISMFYSPGLSIELSNAILECLYENFHITPKTIQEVREEMES